MRLEDLQTEAGRRLQPCSKAADELAATDRLRKREERDVIGFELDRHRSI